ncbi:MAG TPA: DUF3108 domain-containing protein [Candidatus Eisenbacteria bacterium]|nr:DUF3108 domain-containing protein [Candidatus Eisenbacteria bacterium]
MRRPAPLAAALRAPLAGPLLALTLVAGLLAIASPRGASGAADSTRADSAAARAAATAPANAAPEPSIYAAGAGAGAGSLAPVPWKIGEYFQFSIDWNGLNGGSSLMQVQNFHRVDGRRCYRIVTKAESNSFVSKFYKVRDRAESSVDAESLFSRRFMKRLREGGYKKDVDVRFDQAARKAIYENGKTHDVAPGVHDVLSAFYYIRTRPLPDGATIVVPTHDNEKSYEMEVKVLKREKVEVPAGTFACVVVEPKLKSEGIFKSKGSMQVWLTDDERRMPVMVRSAVPVGSISVRLTDYRLAFEGRK